MKTTVQQTLRLFWEETKPQWVLAAAMCCSMILAVVAEMVYPLLFKELVDLFVSGESSRAEVMPQVWTIFQYMLLSYGAMMLFWRFNEFANNFFQPRVMKRIADRCFKMLNQHSYRFFANAFSGGLVRKLNRLVRAFENFADRLYWDVLQVVTRIVITIAVIWSFHQLMGIILLLWTMVFVLLNIWFARWKYPAELEANRWDSRLSAYLADAITNMLNLKLFTGQAYEQRQFEKTSEQWRIKNKWAWDLSSYFNAGQAVLMVILELSIIYLFIRYWEQGQLTVGFLVLVQTYLIGLFGKLWEFGRMIHDIFRAFADAEDMIVILNTPPEVADHPKAKQLQLSKGAIELKQVHFGYEAPKKVLKDFSLHIAPGEKIALVGHSGEGKSTLTKLLMRFFDIQRGEILFDGQNIAEITLKSLRQNISLVPQEPVLFHRSLADNIRYGNRSASKEEVIKAAKLANCHQFINHLQKGYQTLVGERGIKLSGGERQRVAIARAILEDAPIVILDEATSSLDSQSEKLIQQALQRLLKGKTSIIIAHRLSTIMECDRILVIEQGQIAEMGTHEQLLRKKKGRYRALWDIQSGGYIGD